MAQYISLVIKFENNQKIPFITPYLEVFGGKVEGVIFNDAIQEIQNLEERIEKLEE